MNCFQIIKSVLDEAYSQIPGDENEKDEKIQGALEDLRGEYSRLLVECTIDYKDPIIRFAYIYAYVTSHANLVCTLIEDNNNLGEVFDKPRVNVACIGGGPGSDFLGILKYLMTNKKSPKVNFQLCDKEKTWIESWGDVDDKVDPVFRISTSYIPLDVTDPNDWRPHTKYFQSDIFTMIYFMSEVYAYKSGANAYFANLFSLAKSGSMFLFVDNNNPKFYDWFDALAKTHRIDIIESVQTEKWLPFDEQKSDLGSYFEKFSSPKVKANIAYRVGQKK